MNIFGVTSSHMSWLQSRQQILAENIANSDTPGFRARDIADFTLNSRNFSAQLVSTSAKHQQPSGTNDPAGSFEIVYTTNPDVSHSGNNVSLEREMRKVGQASSAFTFDATVSKLFHRMMLMSVKG